MRHRPRRPFPPSHRIHLTPDVTFPHVHSSAIRMSIPRSRWTRARSDADWTDRRISFCEGRRVNGFQWPACKAFAATRFHCCDGSLRWFRIFSAVIWWYPRVAGISAGKWDDMINSGQGAAAAVEIIGSFSQGTMAKGLMPVPGTPAYRVRGRKRLKLRTRRIIPAGSPLSSAMSGLRTLAETTFIAMSSFARMDCWPARSNLTRRRNRSAVTTLATYGNGWLPLTKDGRQVLARA